MSVNVLHIEASKNESEFRNVKSDTEVYLSIQSHLKKEEIATDC